MVILSIIIPLYNREKFIADALNSILSLRTKEKIEIVVVDDGSTDQSVAVVRDWQSSLPADSSVSCVLIQQANSGATVARNNGLRNCRGSHVLFLDSDDVVLPDLIEHVDQALFRKSNIDYCHYNVQVSDEFLQPIPGEYIGSALKGNDDDIVDYHWHTMGAIYKRTAIGDSVIWNESLRASDDWEFAAKIKLATTTAVYLDIVGGLYRDHRQGRLNVYSFDEKYVSNVNIACNSIAIEATHQRRLSKHLAYRLGRRYLVHAIECGANSSWDLRDKLLYDCLQHCGKSTRIFMLSKFLSKLRYASLEKMLVKCILIFR